MDYKLVTILALMIASVLSVPYQPQQPIDVVFADSAAPKCPCTKIYFPLCGSDGKNYNNECEFNCQKRHVRKLGGPEMYVVKEDRCEEIE